MATVLTVDLRRALEAHRVGHLATADAAGRPHLVPITFAISHDAVVFVVDEKPKRTYGRRLKRVRNILANPQVAFLVDDYDEDWRRLGYTMIQGAAEVIDTSGPIYDEAIACLRQRYVQYRDMRLTPARNPVIRISPERVHRWEAKPGTNPHD